MSSIAFGNVIFHIPLRIALWDEKNHCLEAMSMQGFRFCKPTVNGSRPFFFVFISYGVLIYEYFVSSDFRFTISGSHKSHSFVH